MPRRRLASGLLLAVLSAVTFGVSGAFIKPLLDAGWSPGAAVTARTLLGGMLLLPFALIALRGDLLPLWRARRQLLGLAVVGVAGTQVLYFAAISRIPVGTAILIEFMAPLLLVAVAWIRTRRRPANAVLVGALAAAGGLALIVSPSGGAALDPIGLLLATGAMACCAAYFALAARTPDELPPVAVAAVSLLVAATLLGALGALGALPFSATTEQVVLLGGVVEWWIPMLVVALLATAIAYATGISASARLGSRLASFMGLLEVAAAAAWAWLLLDEQLTALQFLGGGLILVGIVAVRSAAEVGGHRKADPLLPAER